MKHKLFASVLVGTLLAAFTACKQDVDLANMDKTVGAEMALALPVGEASMTIGDFLGDGGLSDYIQVAEDGVLFFEDTFKIKRKFAEINLSKYVAETEQKLVLNSTPFSVTYRAGEVKELPFNFTVKFDGINLPGGTERIDSIWVRDAQFISNFSIGGMDIPFSDIQGVRIELDDHFRREKGSTLPIQIAGKGYNQEIPISVDEFILSLMEDRDGSNVVTNEVNLRIVFTLKPQQDLEVQPGAYIRYGVFINFLKYNAVWGIVQTHNQMRDEDTIMISEQLPGWDEFMDLRLPFAEPRIKLLVSHEVAGPLVLDGKYLFAQSSHTNEIRYATFNESRTQRTLWQPLETILSNNTPIDASVTDTLVFSEHYSQGHIDTMFTIFPDRLAYCYEIKLDQTRLNSPEYPFNSYRLTEYTDMNLDAIIHMPLIFNAGVDLSYNDTTPSFSLGSLEVDSLLEKIKNVEFEQASVKLLFQATNGIPFDVDAQIEFLDSLGQPIDMGILNASDSLHIAGPTEYQDGWLQKPKVSNFVLEINEAHLNKLADIAQVVYKVSLGKNTCKVRVLDTSSLKLRLALAADVEAVIDLDAIFDKKQ